MIRRVLLWTLFGGISLLLAWLAMDWVRDLIVIPLTSLFLLTTSFYDSLNQLAAWAVLVVVLSILVVWILFQARRFSPTLDAEERLYPSRVEVIQNWLRMRTKGDYFKWILARHLSQLALDLFAHTEAVPQEELKERIFGEVQGVPAEIQAYMRAGLRPRSVDLTWKNPEGRMRGLKSPLDLDPEVMVRFLEVQLQIVEPEAEGGEEERQYIRAE